MQKQNFSLASARQCKVNIRQYLESLLRGFPASVLGHGVGVGNQFAKHSGNQGWASAQGGWQDSNRPLVYAGTHIG